MDLRDSCNVGRWFGRDDSAGIYEVVVYGAHASWEYLEDMLKHGDSLVLYEEVERIPSDHALGTRVNLSRYMDAVFDEGVRILRVVGTADSATAEPWLFYAHRTFAIFRDGVCCRRYSDDSQAAHLAQIRIARAWRRPPRPFVVYQLGARDIVEDPRDRLVLFHHAVPRQTTVAALAALHAVAPTVAAQGIEVVATHGEVGCGDVELPYAAFYRDGRQVLVCNGPELHDAQLIALAADGRRLADARAAPLQVVGENVFRDYQETPEPYDESVLEALEAGAEASLAAYMARSSLAEWVVVEGC